MQVSFSTFFRQKINSLTPVFMPVNFGKVPDPFDFQRLAIAKTLEENRHEAPQKQQNSSLSIALVDD
jgi:hypothetical protein